MTERTKQLVIVRGGGDIATGTIHKLCRCGYPVLVLESGYPSAIRRCVAFSEAVYDGYPVVKGFKIADIDPRKNEYENCFTISDKARCIAGSVAEGLQMLEVKQGY